MGSKKKEKFGKARAKLAAGKVKKKCCRSDPRCISCPTVAHRIKSLGVIPASLDDEHLKRLLDKVRTW